MLKCGVKREIVNERILILILVILWEYSGTACNQETITAPSVHQQHHVTTSPALMPLSFTPC